MFYIYLSNNINNNLPLSLELINYINIKSSSDGYNSIILTTDPITDDDLTLQTQDQAQTIMNTWTDLSNADPDTYKIQPYLSFDSYVMNGDLKHLVIEQSNIYRIQRGYFTDQDLIDSTTFESFVKKYQLLTQSQGWASNQILYNNTVSLMSTNNKNIV